MDGRSNRFIGVCKNNYFKIFIYISYIYNIVIHVVAKDGFDDWNYSSNRNHM